MEVVGTAPDPFVARDKILALKPDVLTLDLEMPRMDGLTFLKKLMHYQPMPVVVISSLGVAGCQASLEALRLGAVEVLAKPGGPYSVGELRIDLATGSSQPQRPAFAARRRDSTDGRNLHQPDVPHARNPVVIAIGASTGGTEAIEAVLRRLPANCPPIVITQHIPAVFSLAFANRLNESVRWKSERRETAIR